MGGDDVAPQPSEPEPRGFLDRFSLKRLHQAIIATALTVTAAFGGLDRAEPMKQVALGSTYDSGPLTVIPHRVAMLCDTSAPPLSLLDYTTKTETLFALFATVKNTADQDLPLVVHEPMGAHAPDNTVAFTLVSTDDHASHGALGPYGEVPELHSGKTEDVTVVWGVPTGQLKAGDRVTIRINDLVLEQPLAAPIKTWGPNDKGSYGQLTASVDGCAP